MEDLRCSRDILAGCWSLALHRFQNLTEIEKNLIAAQKMMRPVIYQKAKFERDKMEMKPRSHQPEYLYPGSNVSGEKNRFRIVRRHR